MARVAVRYYTAQHAMELNKSPDVQSVANLVKQVCAACWEAITAAIAGSGMCLPADQLWQQEHADGRHDRRWLGQEGRRPGAVLNHSSHASLHSRAELRPQRVQVYGCPISGTLVKEPWAIDGSGSTFIWGFLDSEYRSACLLLPCRASASLLAQTVTQ